MIAVVDLDGVLGDVMTPVQSFIKHTVGHDVHISTTLEEIKYAFKKYDMSIGQMKKMLSDEWFWSKVVPIRDSINAVNRWISLGIEVHIVACRPDDSLIPTKAWLKKHGLVGYSAIKFLPPMHKYEYVMDNRASFMVDDLFYEAYKCAAFGYDSYVVRREYNIEFERRSINPLCRFVDSLSDIYVGDIDGY